MLVATSLPPSRVTVSITSLAVQPASARQIQIASRTSFMSIHGYHFFGSGRMDRHRVVEILAGRAELERHREALQQLVGAGADGVQADDALVGADAHQLHRALHLLLQNA